MRVRFVLLDQTEICNDLAFCSQQRSAQHPPGKSESKSWRCYRYPVLCPQQLASGGMLPLYMEVLLIDYKWQLKLKGKKTLCAPELSPFLRPSPPFQPLQQPQVKRRGKSVISHTLLLMLTPVLPGVLQLKPLLDILKTTWPTAHALSRSSNPCKKSGPF